MKRIILTTFAFVAICANAQIVVEENGHVGVGTLPSGSVISPFTIQGLGNADQTASIVSTKKYGLSINQQSLNAPNSSYNVGLECLIHQNYMQGNAGIYVHFANAATSSYNYGVAIDGATIYNNVTYNYGVFAKQNGGNCAAIYGTTNSTSLQTGITGCYAGYFNGNIAVTGTINGVSISPSDYQLEENIEPLSSSPLVAINTMNVVEFNYKQRQIETAEGPVDMYPEDSPILTHRHYGLIAQELKEIYPDLVIEGEDGYLAVNYVEIIPLLIQSIQELSAKLEAAEKSTEHRGEATAFNATEAIETALFQNTPNPFTETTVIPCAVAEGVAQAVLYVYNLNGEQIAEYPIASRGDTEVTIVGNSLKAGMYLYSLIADGKVIDTKRMILTK